MVKTQVNSDKPKYELLSKAQDIRGDNGVTLLVSHQRVIQTSGSFSDHIVVKKVKRNDDGSQQGYGTNLFIPTSLLPELLKVLNDYNDELSVK